MPNDLQPVRKIRPSSRSITGKFASKKTNRLHPFESSLERDYLILLESDPEVETFVTQPLTIHYTLSGEYRRYTPDVLVYFVANLNKRPNLVEIKYAAELQLKKEELQPRLDAATEYAGERNLSFVVLTEQQIRTDYLFNLKFLSRYKLGSIDNTLSQYILEKITSAGHLKVNELIANTGSSMNGNVLYTIWQLLAANLLKCDMHTKITMTTQLWISN